MFWLPFLAVAALTTGATFVAQKSAQAAAEDQQQRAIEEQRRVDAANQAEQARVTESNREMAREYAETDFAGRLVRESEGAGFNPLTVLRAGGLSAYTNAYGNATAASVESPYYKNPVPQTFIPNTGMALGAAFQAGANVLSGAVTQNAANVSSERLLSMQLSSSEGMHAATLAAQRASPGGSGALSRLGLGAASTLLPSAWDRGDVTVTDYSNPNLARGPGTDPTIPDTEMRETRSAEIVANVIGVRTEIDDWIYRQTGQTLQERIQWRENNERNYLSAISNFTGGLSRWWNTRDSGNTANPHMGQFQPGMGSW